MRIPPTGYLTLALPCGGLVRVINLAHTGNFLVLVVGIRNWFCSRCDALGGLEEWMSWTLDTLCGS